MRRAADTAAVSSAACGHCCTRIVGLSVRLGASEILRNIDLHMHCGEMTAVIGPNGGGKTTLLRAMIGEIAYGGEIRFLDPKAADLRRPVVGYVPQRMEMDRGSPFSVLDLFAGALARRPSFLGVSSGMRGRAQRALARVRAEHLIDRRIGQLSGGEMQRVLLALALEPLPTLLLLDEPVAHVDRRGTELFYELVADLRRSHDLSVLLVSHDLPLAARYADRIVLLDNEIISAGTPEEVFADPRTIEIFGAVSVPDEHRSAGNAGEGPHA